MLFLSQIGQHSPGGYSFFSQCNALHTLDRHSTLPLLHSQSVQSPSFHCSPSRKRRRFDWHPIACGAGAHLYTGQHLPGIFSPACSVISISSVSHIGSWQTPMHSHCFRVQHSTRRSLNMSMLLLRRRL